MAGKRTRVCYLRRRRRRRAPRRTAKRGTSVLTLVKSALQAKKVKVAKK